MADSNHITTPPDDLDLPLSPIPPQTPTSFRFISDAGKPWLSFEEFPDEDTLQFFMIAARYTSQALPKPVLTHLHSLLQQYSRFTPLVRAPIIETGVPFILTTNHQPPSTSNPISRNPNIKKLTAPLIGLSLGISAKNSHGITKQAHPIDPTTTFKHFPNLPPELQLLIWTFAIPEPRLISSRDLSRLKINHRGQAWVHTQCVANIQIPALLHACHPSRSVLRKTYKLEFTENLRRPIYFDMKRDMMMMETLGALHEFSRMSARRPDYRACTVTFLAIRYEAFCGANKRKIESAINECIRRLGNLKELVVVLPDSLPEDFPWGLLKAVVDRALLKMIEYRNVVCIPQGHDKQRCVGWKIPEILFLAEGKLLKRRVGKVML